MSRRLVWLLLALAACSPSEKDAREQAREALARGERGAAIEAIEALRQAAHDTPEAYLEQADLWIRAGEAPRAVWLLDEGVARFPERHDLRLLLASTALLVGDPARADAIAAAIPEDADQYPEALLVRAGAQVALGDLEAGLSTFRAAEAKRPDRPELRIPRVAALLEERRFVEARAALDEAYGAFEEETPRALLRQVELVLLQFQAVEALRQAGEADARGDVAARDQARKAVEEAIVGVRGIAGRAPDDAAAWQALTSLAIAAGQPDLAEPALRAALGDDPQRLGLYPQLATLAVAKGDEAEAERQLRALVERSDAAAARVALARYQAGRERKDEAIALLEQGLAAHGDDALLRFAHAELLLDANQLDAAEQAIARVPDTPTSAPSIGLLRARLSLARGDAADARQRLETLAPQLDTSATQYWFARALEDLGDAAGAAHRYRLAAVRDPNAPGAWIGLLRLAQQRGDWKDAHQVAGAVIQRAPRLIVGWQGLVAAQLEQGQQEAARATAEKAVAVIPDRHEPYVLLAQTLRALGRNFEALAALVDAQARFGERREIAAERVLVLGLAGRFSESHAEAARATLKFGDDASFHRALATAAFQAGQAEEGIAEVERALALDPKDLRPLAQRCQFEAASGRFPQALESCGRFVAQHPENANCLFALAVSHHATGDLDAAEQNYRKAAAADPRAVAPRNNLAVLLLTRGNLDGAIEAAQEAYALAPERPEVIDTLGSLYLKKGLLERAISLLEEAHQRAPQMPDAQLHLAQAYRTAGREADAAPLLEALNKQRMLPPELRAELDATRTR